MNTALDLNFHSDFINKDQNPIISTLEDGKAISFLYDEKWSFQVRVLDRLLLKTQDTSGIPFWLKNVIYNTYFSDTATHSDNKLATISGNIASVRNLLKYSSYLEESDFFSKKSLSSYLTNVRGKYAQTTLAGYLLTYWKLSITASQMSLCTYPKFQIDKLSNKYCNPKHKESKQTLAIPMGIASHIMGNALSLFYAAQKSLPNIIAMMKEYGDIKSEADSLVREKNPNAKLHNSNSHTRIPLNEITRKHLKDSPLGDVFGDNFDPRQVSKWLNRVLYACYTLILAFTGMRKHELFRVHDKSFATYEEDGFKYHTVTSETSKLEEGNDRVDQWVCSEICGSVIDFISQIKKAGKVSSKTIVVVFSNVHKLKTKDSDDFHRRHFENLIEGVTLDDDSYVEFCKLNRNNQEQLEVGSQWPLAQHQWRRTFATLALRFDLATLPAIKRQFKHVSLQMTEWYANYARITQNEELRIDEDLNKLLRDIQNDMSAEVLFDAYNTESELAGGKGEFIMKSRESGSVPTVFSNRATIKSLLERGEAKLQYAGLTYCMNGYKCDQDGLVNAAFCTGCDFALITPDIAKKWQRLHERCVSHLEFASDCGDVSPVSFAHFVSQIRAAERVMLQCKIEFTPYQEAP